MAEDKANSECPFTRCECSPKCALYTVRHGDSGIIAQCALIHIIDAVNELYCLKENESIPI